MKSKRFESEVQVAAEVVRWLDAAGWLTYKEVELRTGGVADIVAVMDSTVWIIETKKSLTTALAAQGMGRLWHAHYVSIAAPSPKTDRSGEDVIDFYCRAHGIGRIAVEWNNVWEELDARVNRQWDHPSHSGRGFKRRAGAVIDETRTDRIERAANIRYLHNFICDKHKDQVAGAAGGGHITQYKKTIDAVREVLMRAGTPLTMKQIVEKVNHHYSSASAARRTLPERLIRLESGFKVREGIWSLRDDDRAEPCPHGKGPRQFCKACAKYTERKTG